MSLIINVQNVFIQANNRSFPGIHSSAPNFLNHYCNDHDKCLQNQNGITISYTLLVCDSTSTVYIHGQGESDQLSAEDEIFQ